MKIIIIKQPLSFLFFLLLLLTTNFVKQCLADKSSRSSISQLEPASLVGTFLHFSQPGNGNDNGNGNNDKNAMIQLIKELDGNSHFDYDSTLFHILPCLSFNEDKKIIVENNCECVSLSFTALPSFFLRYSTNNNNNDDELSDNGIFPIKLEKYQPTQDFHTSASFCKQEQQEEEDEQQQQTVSFRAISDPTKLQDNVNNDDSTSTTIYNLAVLENDEQDGDYSLVLAPAPTNSNSDISPLLEFNFIETQTCSANAKTTTNNIPILSSSSHTITSTDLPLYSWQDSTKSPQDDLSQFFGNDDLPIIPIQILDDPPKFQIIPCFVGNCNTCSADETCVSIVSLSEPPNNNNNTTTLPPSITSFVMHNDFQIYQNQNLLREVASAQTLLSASFCMEKQTECIVVAGGDGTTPGVASTNVRFRSMHYPDYYIIHINNYLQLVSQNDNSIQEDFIPRSTWTLGPIAKCISDQKQLCGQTLSDNGTYKITLESFFFNNARKQRKRNLQRRQAITCEEGQGVILSNGATLDCDGTIFTGQGGGGGGGDEQAGITLQDSSSIIDCVIENYRVGILIDSSQGDRTIMNVEASYNMEHGIFIESTSTSSFEVGGGGIQLYDVVAEYNGMYGIGIGSATGPILIQSPKVEGNEVGIAIQRNTDATIEIRNPRVRQNLSYGMNIHGLTSISIQGGIITKSASHGLFVSREDAIGPLDISDITISDNDKSGLYIVGSQTTTISNVVITNNRSDGIYIRQADTTMNCVDSSNNNGYGIYSNTNFASKIQISNSKIANNAQSNIVAQTGSLIGTNNVYACGSSGNGGINNNINNGQYLEVELRQGNDVSGIYCDKALGNGGNQGTLLQSSCEYSCEQGAEFDLSEICGGAN